MQEYIWNIIDKPLNPNAKEERISIVFVLYVDGKYKNRSVYFKDLKFGFSKSAYIEELTRKREEQEEIEELGRLEGLVGIGRLEELVGMVGREVEVAWFVL